MSDKMVWPFCLLLFTFILGGNVKVGSGVPYYPNPFGEQQSIATKPSGNGRVLVAELDKPIDALLQAVMELGGNVLFLVPPRDFEKRDPPDLGTGRSYTGQRTAKVMWGQLASNSPSGPGRRKRDATSPLNTNPDLGIPPGARLLPEELEV